MQNKYALKITTAAQADLDEIFSYIFNSLSAPKAAINLINKIEMAVKSLSSLPYRCPESKDDLLKAKGYHKLLIENYIALYLIDESQQQVIVARVLYSAMDYGKYI